MGTKKTLLVVFTILLILTSCGKKEEPGIIENLDNFSKGIEEFGKGVEGMADKINQAADMINNSIVEVEDNGESKACDIIKDDETRKICVNSCFPSMILAGQENALNDDYKKSCLNSAISIWAKKELDLSHCDYSVDFGNPDEEGTSKYACIVGVMGEKYDQGKSASTADCASIENTKLYDSCIGIIASYYSDSESVCDETKTEEGNSTCKSLFLLHQLNKELNKLDK